MKQEQQRIKFTINKITFTLSISDFINLDLQAQVLREKQGMDFSTRGRYCCSLCLCIIAEPQLFGAPKPGAPVAGGVEKSSGGDLSEEELRLACDYFKKHILAPPLRQSTRRLTSLIRALGLPHPTLKEFIQLMKRDLTPPGTFFVRCYGSVYIYLTLSVPLLGACGDIHEVGGVVVKWALVCTTCSLPVSQGMPALVHDKSNATISFLVLYAHWPFF